MRTTTLPNCTLLVGMIACLMLFQTPLRAEEPQSADAMLKQIQELVPPAFDSSKQKDEAYVRAYRPLRNQWAKDKAALQKKFLDAYPEHPEAAKIRQERWQLLLGVRETAVVQAECEELLKQPGHENDLNALFMLATAGSRGGDVATGEAAVERFIKAAPNDERGAQLLFGLTMSNPTSDKSKEIIERVIRDYPKSAAAMTARGQQRRTTELGKPFELSFTDAISGKSISMTDLKGKVVVIDFWATWCGPCVAEMPELKALYSEYKPKGVEFIGVSLDQSEKDGGLQRLKDFVAKNDIGWPQYYQGKGWDGDFSKSWGVNSIPCMFVVDAEGKLASTSARGQLEKLLPELIAKRDIKSADAGR